MTAEDRYKNFVILHFEKDNRFAVVPSNWLSSDSTECAWPGRKVKNPLDLQCDPFSLPDKNFKYYKVKVHKSYDDYDKAVRKSEDLRTKHDVDTTDTDASPHTVNQPPPPPIIPVPESSAFGG
ncbi:uncharacterized protein LOC118439076 [Folsomia candida]|uniref:uncharacterized protein LOC118439076 n=1 Tax=Folsomia candida TaxID=158441 RepID=UPI0016052375|nr:uncharacterized protein LOC118439076 [Folsomia candida]